MPEITETELEEYRTLKNAYGWQAVEQSLSGVELLENDVDEPIKWTVAALTLLGVQPVFSCCGFNYVGQPLHKRHTVGTTYISVLANAEFNTLCEELNQYSDHLRGWWWEIVNGSGLYKEDQHGQIYFSETWARHGVPEWDDPLCIHYSEMAALAIRSMNVTLYRNFWDKIHLSAVLTDSNGHYQSGVSAWQYPAKKEWLITREWLVDNYKESGIFNRTLPARFLGTRVKKS